MAPTKKLEDSLSVSVNKVRDMVLEEAKSSLAILKKSRNEFEQSENYNAETEDASSKEMYKQQLIVFISILAYDWDKLVLAMQTFLDIASKLMPNLPEGSANALKRTCHQYIEMHSSDQFKLVLGKGQIQVEDEFFGFVKGNFQSCKEITQKDLGDIPIEIVTANTE